MRIIRTLVIIALTLFALVGVAGAASAGTPRPAPKSECKAAARIIKAIDAGIPVYSDDLSFRGMPKYVDAYNDRLAARFPYGAAPSLRAWLAGEVANGCAGAR
ncbi:MAG TPA: hypothetical protein VIU11_14385 [Nakamurella sp.]